MNNLKILKIGGSIITEKERDEPSPDFGAMERVAREIKQGLDGEGRLVLVHGAGSYGHPIVKRTEIHKGLETEEDMINFAETQRLQNELNSVFTGVLIENDIPAFPVQASASAVMDGDLKRMSTEVVGELVRGGVVPVLYGVPAYDESKGCSILSGDEIIPYLASELGADEVLHGTNVDGIYTSDPGEDRDAELIDRIESLDEAEDFLAGSGDTDVTGGMLNKVKELKKLGVSGRIFNAGIEGNVSRALRGGDVGTYID